MWKTFLWSDKLEIEIIFGNHRHHFICTKEKGIGATCSVISTQCKSQSLWWHGGVLIPKAWAACTAGKKLSEQICIYIC